MHPAASPFLSLCWSGSGLFSRGAWRGWLAAVAVVAIAPAVKAGEPLAAFALGDLNMNSARVSQTISPRDYGQWVSAYYFGNEG